MLVLFVGLKQLEEIPEQFALTKDNKLEIIRAIAQATIAVLQRIDLSKCYLDHQRTQLGCALVLLNKLWKYESIGRVLVAELIE